MAKFLETQAISNELMKLIKDAKDKIILVSPYLKVNSQIQERLKTKSKIGTLSEIVIVYGKSELKKTELEWIKEIEDLKVIEKNNLHAKCYLNEDKAIICSMNLYDYSQQHNIEMGILITRKDDPEAYQTLIDEINNIKVNGVRKKFDSLNIVEDPSKIASISNAETDNSAKKPVEIKQIELTPQQKLKFQLLKEWRLNQSREEKASAFLVLTDEEIRSIVSNDKLDSNSLYNILPKKKAIKYGEEIFKQLKYADEFTIVKVVNVWFQENSNSYDRVKLKILTTGEEKWFDTTYELPNKDKIVAAKLNKGWLNRYLYLDN
jgi:hypothetical protein